MPLLFFGRYAVKNGSVYEVSSENQGSGIIHWCKIWYDDLGDDLQLNLLLGLMINVVWNTLARRLIMMVDYIVHTEARLFLAVQVTLAETRIYL